MQYLPGEHNAKFFLVDEFSKMESQVSYHIFYYFLQNFFPEIFCCKRCCIDV